MSQLLELMNQHVAAIRELKVSEFDDETLRLLTLDVLTTAKGYGADEERANAAALCKQLEVYADKLRNDSDDDFIRQLRMGEATAAHDLADAIKSGERVAPVDGVADGIPLMPVKAGEPLRCARCLLPLSSGDSVHTCPDPAAAVTADEVEPDESWAALEVHGGPARYRDVDVLRADIGLRGRCFRTPTGQWIDVGGGVAQEQNWTHWRSDDESTAPPVADVWRKTVDELPPIDTPVGVRDGNVMAKRYLVSGHAAEKRWGGNEDRTTHHLSFWPEWRYLQPSASDPVEADVDPRDRTYWQAAYMDLERVNIKTEAERDEAVKARIEMHTAMNGMQDMWRECEGRVIVAEEDRDRYAADMGRMRLEIIGLENERGALTATCRAYERTVTGLRQRVEPAQTLHVSRIIVLPAGHSVAACLVCKTNRCQAFELLPAPQPDQRQN